MNDRELLELAARAAGYDYLPQNRAIVVDGIPGNWSPLDDDGDALRLAVQLDIDVLTCRSHGEVLAQAPLRRTVAEPIGDCAVASTRRAIVRAAAAMAERGEQSDG